MSGHHAGGRNLLQFRRENVPPHFGEVSLTPEEQDRLHKNYLHRKANGKQKQYEDSVKAVKKAEIAARKSALRTEDMAKGVFIPVCRVCRGRHRRKLSPASVAV